MPETNEAPPATPRRRRRLSLSLRVLMLLVLVVAVPMAWVITEARTQREAVAEVKRLGQGGLVKYDYEYSGGKNIPGGRPRGPAWLRSRLGIDYFHRVTEFGAYGAKGDQMVHALDRLPHVESLWLVDSKLADRDLARIARHDVVRDINLSGASFTDAGVTLLARLPELRSLDLGYSEITDAGVSALVRCPRLERLDLIGTKVTGKGIELLAEIPSLRHVALSIKREDGYAGLRKVRRGESLTIDYFPVLRPVEGYDDGSLLFACLRSLPRLKSLTMQGWVTDKSLVGLADLKGLEDLDLSDSIVTDAGLMHLHGMTHLKRLRLGSPQVTPGGIASLRAALPSLKITP